MSLVDIFNKKSIVYSSPLAYTLLMSVSLAVFNLFLSIRIKKPDFGIYLLKDRKTNFYLLMVGLFASATTILLPFAYKLLPLGILTTIASLRVFISLWISHKKYFEDGLKIKLIATAVALLGTIIVVAG